MGGYPNPRDCSNVFVPMDTEAVYVMKSHLDVVKFIELKVKYKLWSKILEKVADKGRKIEIRLKDAVAEVTSDSGCVFAGVEIKLQKDQLLTGYRFCTKQGGEDKVFVSKTDTVPVILYRSMGMVMATLEYRMI
ncbi:unnamed protein product [Cylicocyclus nassatus]|uniref:Uncharacterized protein n=1 Tax=Cylicocyclus nassatus TaxID=53992 RepID=A0AA36MD51_CYLNA|nr:unnamed protein product [Cylicocyclus nassatus]